MFRWLIWITMVGTLLSLPVDSQKALLINASIAVSLVHIVITTWLTRRFPLDTPKVAPVTHRIRHIIATIDSVAIGYTISLTEFSPIPTLMFITVVQFYSLTNINRAWAPNNLALVAGTLPILIIEFRSLEPAIHTQASLISTIGVTTYCCLVGYTLTTMYNNSLTELGSLNNTLRKHKLRAYKLTQYVSPAVWKTVNEDRKDKPRTQRKPVTIFFSDIKDFSRLSEELEPETLTELLNTYLTEMAKIIRQYGGTIDKFMGDGIMVIFGDDDPKGKKEDALRCVEMSLEMRRRMNVLQQVWMSQGVKRPLQIRMGVNTGFCTVGTFGTSHHLDYTALGTQVNLASRLESSAAPGEILISHETWSLIKDTVMCRDRGEITVKGITHPIKVYSVVELRKNLGKNQTYFEKNLEGFSLHVDLDKVSTEERDQLVRSLAEISRAVSEL